MTGFSTDHVLFGVAYYDEYMPYDRLDKDIEMMKAANINVVRIAESTWSTMEPQPGCFDFSHIDRVLVAMGNAGIGVIVGTPTYAVPTWLTAAHPDVLAHTHRGPGRYGPRQIMDIANPSYRFYAERAIRALLSHVAQQPAVIGYQLDNETKYYDVTSRDVQRSFIKHLRELFNDDLDAMNAAYGLDYWSNRVNAWEDFPDVSNTINGSLGAEFDAFRRSLVTEFLQWQANLVRQYARDDQFVTQNYDLEWRGHTYGLQEWADDFAAAKCLDVVGVDIYHPTQDDLTGVEIAFGGDLARSCGKGRNYLLLETEAQGQNGWVPYPGQLRLQAYSHLASGSDSVMYWHWHSLHNSFETYWKGLLSQDFEPNALYEEAAKFGAEIQQVGKRLVDLRKCNKVAIMVDNRSLTALRWATIDGGFPDPALHSDRGADILGYNDVVRWIFDALYGLNIECDFVTEDTPIEQLESYKLLFTPAMYSVSENCIDRLRRYVSEGGYLVSTFKSFFTDRNLKVWHDRQPHSMNDIFGMHYSLFTTPKNDGVVFADDKIGSATAAHFMELLLHDDATQVLAKYANPAWKQYAAVTRHSYGRGTAVWVGTQLGNREFSEFLAQCLDECGLQEWVRQYAGHLTIRRGVNKQQEDIAYLLNYSPEQKSIVVPFAGEDVLTGECVEQGDVIEVDSWSVRILTFATRKDSR